MKIDTIASDYLGRVRLRLLDEPERGRFDLLLESRHYLKSSRIGGRHIRYVAEVDGEWVALLTFSGAAPQLKGREKWIGWSPRQQARRLGLVCNNSRFLLLVERERHPNLASKILGLALRRLARACPKNCARPKPTSPAPVPSAPPNSDHSTSACANSTTRARKAMACTTASPALCPAPS